jgi:alkylation response protein AidB-like acyl-CoA dehydrogenase
MTERALTQLAEDEQMFFDAVLGFAREQIGPHVASMDAAAAIRPELLPQLFGMGLMGIEIPEEFGGAGSTFFHSILAIEALSMVDPSVSVLVDVQNTLVINALRRWGSPEIQSTYFPKLASEWVGAYCLSEPSSGSDAFALKTRAEKRGDDWVINGQKLWITNANEANLSAGYKGITAFLVERDTPGFDIGKKEDKLGIRASSTCPLMFEDCVVPHENVVGEVGKGYKIAIETLNEGRIGIGAQMVGLAQGAFDNAMVYLLEREQFGKPLASFQGIQFQYARMAMEIEAARLMVYNAARLKQAGKNFLKEAAMAKLYTSEVAERTASVCIDLFGGVGYTKEFPAEKYYRDAKIGKIYEGTSNMQLNTIAKILSNTYSARG